MPWQNGRPRRCRLPENSCGLPSVHASNNVTAPFEHSSSPKKRGLRARYGLPFRLRPNQIDSSPARWRPALARRQPAHRRLGGQIPTRRQRSPGHLEDRSERSRFGVVAVLVAGSDHLHAKADHVGQAVGGLVRTVRIVDAARRRSATRSRFPPRPEPERRCWTTAYRRRNGRRRTCRPLMTNRSAAA